MEPPADTTRLLKRLAAGDAHAGDELLPLVYADLHRIAAACMAGERKDHTLQPTALVHEAWMRLQMPEGEALGGRAQFLSVAARAMRRALIDHARKRNAQKRGEGVQREPLDVALELYEETGPELLQLEEALEELETLDPQLVTIVEQRFFAGATHEDIAAGIGVSTRTVERGWKTAQTWLRSRLRDTLDGA